jgi:hypothetical protein
MVNLGEMFRVQGSRFRVGKVVELRSFNLELRTLNPERAAKRLARAR